MSVNDNPGDKDFTEPAEPNEPTGSTGSTGSEAHDADPADAAAQAADASELDPTLEADLAEALADIDPDAPADADGDGEVDSVEAQLAERTEDLQRLSAEYANYRRRTDRERKVSIDNAKAQVIAQLLPVLDDLELAEKHGDLAEGPLKVFRDKFVGILDGLKVTSFGEEGDAFDPERHEAVQDLSTGDEKAIGTVLRKGYQLDERLLRTAMVIIADPA